MTDAETLPSTGTRITFPEIDPASQEVTLEPTTSPWAEVTYRYFAMEPGEPLVTAVERLASTVPELPDLALEHIGGPDGVDVLRAGDHRVAILDAADVGEVARAANVLLGRHGELFRFVPLRAGGAQGLFAAATAEESIELLDAGLLALDGLAELFDLANF